MYMHTYVYVHVHVYVYVYVYGYVYANVYVYGQKELFLAFVLGHADVYQQFFTLSKPGLREAQAIGFSKPRVAKNGSRGNAVS